MARRWDGAAVDVLTFSREEFIQERFAYEAGEHCTIMAPSGGGKTQIAFQLLGSVISPKLPCTVFVMKPKDATVDKFAAEHKLRVTRNWPPPKLVGAWGNWEKPAGYVLWPKERGDPDFDNPMFYTIFRRALLALYRKGNNIAFADEVVGLTDELGLERELRMWWMRGRSLGSGLWSASQRPVELPRLALQAHHVFIGSDPDEQMQKRYAEIGAVAADVIRDIVSNLELYQFCYIHRDTRTVCIVDKD